MNRRSFITTLAAGAGSATIARPSKAQEATNLIQGFEQSSSTLETSRGWRMISDRKIRVGIAGYGVCKFGSEFGFQDHPNVEVAAVSDLFPDRCAALARVCRCQKTYPSLEKMIEDETIEAVFVATDAPSHARHCQAALKKGKHVACAVPAVFGSLEDAEDLFHAVRKTGLNYMMFETSFFHEDLHAMRQLYKRGALGKVLYAEGEYYHYMEQPIDSYKGWRVGLPPQWYPTHSNAYYIGATGGSFIEVSCLGAPSRVSHLQTSNNTYRNNFGSEIALFRTSEGGMARMAVSWDSPGAGGEMGRIRGEKGSFYGTYEGLEKIDAPILRPPLPPSVSPGGHGGSHGYLMDEFVTSILQNRTPLVHIAHALNLTVSGIVAHHSAIKGGEVMKIPQYQWGTPLK